MTGGDRWFKLKDGRSLLICQPRKPRNKPRPEPAFLVLGRRTDARRAAPVVCSGDFADGRVRVEKGVISESMRAEIQSCFVFWRSFDAPKRRFERGEC